MTHLPAAVAKACLRAVAKGYGRRRSADRAKAVRRRPETDRPWFRITDDTDLGIAQIVH